MPDLDTQPYTAPEFQRAGPNAELDSLLTNRNLELAAEDFYDDADLRRMETLAAMNDWRASAFEDMDALDLIVAGHTVEAMQQHPNRSFLQRSIGGLMLLSEVRPTANFVTPKVVNLLDDEQAQAYLSRMLGAPSDPYSGWLPIPTEHSMVTSWRNRFSDVVLRGRLTTHLDYLALLHEEQRRVRR